MLNKKTTVNIKFSNQFGICVLLFSCLVYIFSYYFPFIMEYYVKRPSESFFAFLMVKFCTAMEYSYYEMIILFLVIMIIYSITFRFDITFIIISAAGIILTYASNLKYVNRLELLNYTDLKITEAAGMAMNYLDIKIDKYTIYTLLFVIIITLCSFILQKYMRLNSKQIVKRKQIIIRFIMGCSCTIILLTFHTYFMDVEFSKNPYTRYEYFSKQTTNHVLFQFLQKTQSSYKSEEILQSYSELTDKLIAEDKNFSNVMVADELPTIIVIMNESWWNVENISSDYVSYSTNPMDPLYKLAGTCDIGTTSVNIYGGGTISSEAEFLIGFNTKYFTGTAGIYDTLEGRAFPSIVEYFDELGYTTTAIHPYYSDFYKRESIYQQMKFDTCIFEDDMQYTDVYDKYISDASLVNQIISEYEKNPSNPNFIFSVSMASHGRNLDYKSDETTNYPYTVNVSLNDNTRMSAEGYAEFIHYVNGIYESNVAFAKLVDYFEKQERPVIILMYGDHCPNFNTETLASFGMDVSNNGDGVDNIADMLIQQVLYTTPFIAYNNFSDEPFVMDGENITAISDKLIDYIGLPSTRMTLINKYMRTILKTDIRSYMLDRNGDLIKQFTDEQASDLETLLMIQYDILYGNSVCDNLWEPLE